MAAFEKYPSMRPRNTLLPLFGIALSAVLPEPDSAPRPVVSSCISSMVPLSVMWPEPSAAPMKNWLRKPSNDARVPVLPWKNV